MSQMSRPANYVLIEDQLDAVGQKYRVQRMIRGGALWLVGAVVSTLVATLIAHWVGQSSWNMLIAALWLGWLLLSAAVWFIRPLAMHPKPVEVARLVESKMPDLHNGLTNSVLLSKAADLQSNPWLPAIFDEILIDTRRKPLDEAVALGHLKPLLIKLAYVLVPALVLMVLLSGQMAHGWQQMFSPTKFVPVTGSMEIVDVQPGDVTLVMGQPLEIIITAKGPLSPNARLIFDNPKFEQTELIPTPNEAGQLKYSYRSDHVDDSMKYRVEVGPTQSPWYSINVVREVKMTDLVLTITPPTYTKVEGKSITMAPEDVGKTPISAPLGSKIDVVMGTDVPATSAILQAGEDQPVTMDTIGDGKRFSGAMNLAGDREVAVLIMQNGQVIQRLPSPAPLSIQATRDAAPSVTMRWPTSDLAMAPDGEIKIAALLKDDYGVSSARILMGVGTEGALKPAHEETFADVPKDHEFTHVLELGPELRKHGNSIRVQVEVTDNRDLRSVSESLGQQTASSPIYEIKFRDPETIAKEDKEKADKLRERLMELLKMQSDLHSQAVGFAPGGLDTMKAINTGQGDLRTLMQQTAQGFEFDENTKVIQKTLLVLVYNPAKEAVEISESILGEQEAKEQKRLNKDLQEKQRRIITTLESLLALLNPNSEPTTQPTQKQGGDLENKQESLKKLNEALKEFMKEEQRIIDQSAQLAKKPVDNWDDADKKMLDDLLQSQDKMDAFMKATTRDLSKMTEQDMANASLLSQTYEVYSEVTMAKDALKQKNVEMATALEDNAVGLAQEMSMNIEKWLANAPDRQKWEMEDQADKHDMPMPELPKELEDMVGELMEQQEDLFEEMEDASANYAQSEGSGWDAADGPIESMSAQGVTGNTLPNNNDMGGRSGEGRSGRSQGEMVEDSAVGKGGRNTPTRLDPTPFQQGQIKDTGTDPVGGATGGGKISGQGGQGLEGPVPPQLQQEMARLKEKQAQIRNNAERLNLQYGLGKYDNFKMLQSVALMRRVESDLGANRYNNALRRKDVLLDSLDTSHLLMSGEIHVQQDTSPKMSARLEDEINDAMKGQLPAAWSDALKEYYKKLASE